MPFTAKRTFPFTFVENGVFEAKITKGMIESGILLSGVYNSVVTGAATSIRALAHPIKRILVIADNKYVKVIKGADLVTIPRVFEQTALAALIVPPSAVGVATYPNCEFNLPVFFCQPGIRDKDGRDSTDLPTWAYGDITLRVEMGSHADLFVGGAGSVNIPVGSMTFTQLDVADLTIVDPNATVRSLKLHVERYIELPVAAAALAALKLEIGNTSDIRAIVITQEDANGEPTNGIINTVTLKENNTTEIISGVPWRTIRTDNARLYGVTMPTGVAVLEFADDGDVRDIYRGSQKSKVDLFFNTNAVAGNIRAHLLTIERALGT